jgi:hypothetical protein
MTKNAMKALSFSMSLLAVAAMELLATQAKATVTIDVRAISATGGAVVKDDRNVVVSAIGQIVRFQAYAHILGNDGNITNEGFQSTICSFVETRDSSLWEARGDMSAPSRLPPFNAQTSQDGHVVDVNGDGDKDIGHLYGGSGSSADSFVPRSDPVTFCTTSSDLPLGTFDWTVTGVQTSGAVATTITCVPYMMTNPGALYYIDGVFKNAFNATTPPGGGGTGVSVTVAPTLFPGDANGDGTVDIADLSALLSNYDKTGMGWSQGDFDGNGAVDIQDLSNVLTNYDKTAGASAGARAVPEPTALVLTGLGFATFLAWSNVVVPRMRRKGGGLGSIV